MYLCTHLSMYVCIYPSIDLSVYFLYLSICVYDMLYVYIHAQTCNCFTPTTNDVPSFFLINNLPGVFILRDMFLVGVQKGYGVLNLVCKTLGPFSGGARLRQLRIALQVFGKRNLRSLILVTLSYNTSYKILI